MFNAYCKLVGIYPYLSSVEELAFRVTILRMVRYNKVKTL